MKYSKKRIIVLTVSAAIITLIVFQQHKCPTIISADTIRISTKSCTITKGKTKTLSIFGTKKKVTWKSSKPAIATISQKGKLTGKKVGTSTITATVGKKKFTCVVTVKIPVNKYVSSAPFKAIEKKVGNFRIVIPKEWSFSLNEPSPTYQSASIRLDGSSYPLIIFQYTKTERKALDFPSLKKELDQTCSLEALKKSFASSEDSENVPIENYTNSELKIPHGSAYKISYSFTIPKTPELDKKLSTIETFPLNMINNNITMQQFVYILQIDGYTIQLNASTPWKMDLEKISDYIMKTFTFKH